MGLIKPRVEVNNYTTSQLLAKVRAQNNTTVIVRDRTTQSGGYTKKGMARKVTHPTCLPQLSDPVSRSYL